MSEAGAIFVAELTSTVSDKLQMSGAFTLDAGAVLSVVNDGTVIEGQIFEIISGFTGAAGKFASGDTITDALGQQYDIAYGANSITLTAIPEPSTYALIGGLAVAGIALVVRRRRK